MNLDSITPSQSLISTQVNKNKTNKKINKFNNNNNIYQKTDINNYKKYNPNKKPMKVLTFKKNEFNMNYINKRNNSSGENRNRNRFNNSKTKFGGERLYEQHMKKMQKQEQMKERLLKEKLEEENKEFYYNPKINENSRRIVERLRNNEGEDKVEERLLNYGYNKKQKHLIQHANNDIRSKTISPFKPKINANSRNIANKNKKNRINETNYIIKEKKKRINYKKIDLDKEFGKRNRSIGEEHRNKNSFINFDNAKNSDKINNINISKNKNKNPFKKANINNDNNYNVNTYRNSKYDNNTYSDENKATMSQLNKTLELNNVYKELYNSIDEKIDSDLTRFFNSDANSNLTENNVSIQNKTKSNLSDIKKKNLFNEERRAVTPPSYSNNYNAFDYLYYESERLGEKNKKKQELNFKRNHPFRPRISPYSQQLKKKKETTKEFLNRISKNLEEIKIINNSNMPKINKKNKFIEQNNKNDFRPKITRGPKSPNQRNISSNLDGYYDQRLTKEKKDLQRMKKEEEKEKKNIYNQKSKDIIM